MTARERWQALQTSLTAARAAVDRGDTAAALVAVDAALELDPNFLAAHSLRDRIVAGDMPAPRRFKTLRVASADTTASVDALSTATFEPSVTATVELSPAASAEPSPLAPVEPTAMLDLPLNAVVEPPPDSPVPDVAPPSPAEGYKQFERRMRRRRVDGRIDAARQAIERKHVRHAAAALEEVIELDPNLPELSELTVQFDQLRRSTAGAHVGPWLAAGAVFAGSVFGATTWFRDASPPLVSQSVIATMLLPEGQTPSLSISPDPEQATTTVAVQNVEVIPVPRRIVSPSVELKPAANVLASATVTRPPAEPVAVVPAAAPPAPRPQQAQLPQPPQQALTEIPVPPQEPPAVVAAVAPRPVPDSVVAAAATVPFPPEPNVQNVDEHAMVAQTLQRYRRAYDGLDAQSAHAVWPAVNQAALARAFDGLQSQKLTFDACDVRVSGEAATATCQGSARYVPKIGSREPRTESRVWNFILHKSGADWKIDSARAERN